MPRSRRVPLVVLGIAGLLPGLAYAWWIWRDHPTALLSRNGAPMVRDYIILWAGGHLALEGRVDAVFDPAAYQAWLQGVFGPGIDLHTFSYLPPMLLLAVPFAMLPLLPGFLAWSMATLAALATVLRAAGMPAILVAAVMVSPAALENMLAGQNGALTAMALAGGLLMAQAGRPVAAGLLLGLLVLKPQMGVLVPVCLIASRDWRAVLCTGAATLFYAAITLPAFGIEAWQAYREVSGPFILRVLEAPFGLAFQREMPSPFMTLRAMGAGLATAYAVQAVATLGCALVLIRAWWLRRGTEAVALALLLSPLATPYAHSYDLVGTAVGIALLAPGALASDAPAARFWRRGLALGWLWPGVAMFVGTLALPGLGPLMLAPAIAYAALRALGGPAGPETGAVEKIRTSTGFPLPAPQAGASTIPPRPQTG